MLARDDLRRAGGVLGLGVRQGERAYVLKSLLAQEPTAVLGWLGQEATRWAGIHASLPDDVMPVRDFWRGRAEASAELAASLTPSVV